MRKLLLLIPLTLLLSCGNDADLSTIKSVDVGWGLQVVEVDSCEYIYSRDYKVGTALIHKQNCKYCIERKKDTIK